MTTTTEARGYAAGYEQGRKANDAKLTLIRELATQWAKSHTLELAGTVILDILDERN